MKSRGRNQGRHPPHTDPRMAVGTADAFRSLADVFIRKVAGRSWHEGQEIAAQDPGGVIASATSLAPAMELYLKALCFVTGASVPRDHDLWGLYMRLRQDVRVLLEKMYDNVPPTPDGQGVTLDLALTFTPDEPIPESTSRRSQDRSLPSVL